MAVAVPSISTTVVIPGSCVGIYRSEGLKSSASKNTVEAF